MRIRIRQLLDKTYPVRITSSFNRQLLNSMEKSAAWSKGPVGVTSVVERTAAVAVLPRPSPVLGGAGVGPRQLPAESWIRFY